MFRQDATFCLPVVEIVMGRIELRVRHVVDMTRRHPRHILKPETCTTSYSEHILAQQGDYVNYLGRRGRYPNLRKWGWTIDAVFMRHLALWCHWLLIHPTYEYTTIMAPPATQTRTVSVLIKADFHAQFCSHATCDICAPGKAVW